MNKKRENNFDVLRIFAMVMVIINHVADYYLVKTNMQDSIIFLFEGIAHCANPVFLMLTGAFALEKSGGVEPEQFWKKAFYKLGLPTIIFAVMYWAFDIYSSAITNPFRICKDIATGFYQIYPHWYMSMLAGIYFVLPFVARAKKHVSEKTYRKAVIAYFVWAIVGMYFDEIQSAWIIGLAMSYMSYVLLGNILKEWSFKKSNKVGVLLIILGSTIVILDYYIIYLVVQQGGSYYNKFLWGYKAPLMIVGILMVYIGFNRVTVKKSFAGLANYSFYIYLSHKLIMNVLYYYGTIPGVIERWLEGHNGIIICVMAMLIFILSYAAAVICSFMQGQLQRRNNAMVSQ